MVERRNDACREQMPVTSAPLGSLSSQESRQLGAIMAYQALDSAIRESLIVTASIPSYLTLGLLLLTCELQYDVVQGDKLFFAEVTSPGRLPARHVSRLHFI